ncbi:MAG: 4Fe-4S dicluster domain-containing protein [Planctomycetota bacterium]
MKVAVYHISEADLAGALGARKGTLTFGALVGAAPAWLALLESGCPIDLGAFRQPRAAQSPKGFFLPAAESVGRYGPQASPATATETKQLVLLGVRACELRARKYLDEVMLAGEFDDPAYRARREATTIVSCDCVAFADSCFCTSVGGAPFATEGFDINLSPLNSGWLAEVATDKGRELLGRRDLVEAGPGYFERRDQVRRQMTERVSKQNANFAFAADDTSQPRLPEGADDAWQGFAADCVECAACTHICPTCHCFYLYDQLLGPDAFERVRTWDSCLLSTYHRMAGGENMKLTPRARLSSRLANRILHKFTYSPQQYGMLGCVGCGRCVDACLGAIDIRQVVDSLGQGPAPRSVAAADSGAPDGERAR